MTRKSGEARSGVTRQTALAPGLDWLDCIDEIRDCSHAIETWSGLLRGYGDDQLDGELVRRVGGMLDGEIQQLKIALQVLQVRYDEQRASQEP